jgi:3-deoxy-D-manno-octulosonic-acid transferase
MIRLLYSLLLYFAVPFILMRLYLRGMRSSGYRQRITERFGYFYPAQDFDNSQTIIWIHAVSVGETVAAEPLVKAIKKLLPEVQILITSMTPTGAERVESLFGNSVFHSYLPYDLPTAVNRFLNSVNPDLLIIMETELWPNLIHQCKQRGVKTLLANARLSAKSAAGYWRFSGITRSMLQSLSAIAAQSNEDANRLEKLGAYSDSITVTGNLKFNVEHPPVSKDTYLSAIKKSGRTVIIAASTREGEELKVLSAFQRILKNIPEVLFILVPRHPERFNEIADLALQKGFSSVLRSEQTVPTADIQLIIGDSMGEMGAYYAVSDIAFVGGSLVDTGCQNVLEPAALSIPVIVGPSQFNFAQICKQLENAGGLRTVANESELASVLTELVKNGRLRKEMGQLARGVIDSNQKALPNLMKVINGLIGN